MHSIYSVIATLMITTVYGAANTELVQRQQPERADRLFRAVQSYNIPIIKELLTEVNPNACACPVLGGVLSRFIERAQKPHPAIPTVFQLLIDAGADVHARNLTGGTVLHVLATSELPNEYILPCLRMALNAGADVKKTQYFCGRSKTALQRAEHKLQEMQACEQKCNFCVQRMVTQVKRVEVLRKLRY